MKSPLPKVVHPVLGVPMVIRVVRQAMKAGYDKPVVVVGHGRKSVIPLLENEGISWAVQEEQLGTAHALSCGVKDLIADDVTVLLGDVPLLRSHTITELSETRRKADAGIAVLTTFPPDSSGYGRVVRKGSFLSSIVEERDATPEQLSIGEINTGIMSFDGSILPVLLKGITTDNDQKEYYLTDAITIARSKGIRTTAVVADDWREVAGINDRVQLAEATGNLRQRVINEHLRQGVIIPDPNNVWIEESVTIGNDVSIGRSCRLSGRTLLGDGCILGDGCVIVDTVLPAGTVLEPFTVTGWSGKR
ncbi:MAG: NTP transferase domain-containing protein [Candidatus Aegiribacteria sp.]|nr:NTP transferase domain-containing protein [Candidatus Aegiribacteria sp.]